MKDYSMCPEYLIEAHINTEGAFEALLPYKDNPNIYLRMSKEPTINKISGFLYPLREVWRENINRFSKDKKEWYFPSGGNSTPYIHIFKLINRHGFMDIIDYKEKDLERDLRKLRVMASKVNLLGEIDECIKNAISPSHRPFAKFYSIIEYMNFYGGDKIKHWIGYHDQVQFRYEIFKRLDYTGFVDKIGEGFILYDDSIIAIFFDNKPLKYIETIKNVNK